MGWIAGAWRAASAIQKIVIAGALLIAIGAIGNALGPTGAALMRHRGDRPNIRALDLQPPERE
jgi:hypothetical protein